MPSLLHLVRIRCEHPVKGIPGVPVVEIHPRIIQKVGLRYADFPAAVSLDHQRKERNPVLVPLRQADAGVGILKGVEELAGKVIPVEIPDIRHISLPVIREHEFSLLRPDLERLLGQRDETVCHTVIISPENQVETLEAQCQLVEAVQDLGPPVVDRLNPLVHSTGLLPDEPGADAVACTVVQFHRHL